MKNLLIGVDLGYGAIKLASQSGTTQLPSFVGLPRGERIASVTGIKKSKASLLIEHDGGAFYVGRNAHNDGQPLENLDYERLTGSPEIRALFYGALSEHADQIDSASIMVGLPLSLLGEENKAATASAMKKWLRGDHEWTANGEKRTITIEQVDITSQPAGALFDFVFDDAGKPTPFAKLAKKEIGMLSVGFNTIEMMTLNGGQLVQRLSGSTENGVRRLLEQANPDNSYSLGELDAMLRRGTLDIDAAVEVWSRAVNGDIESQWGKTWKRFERILIVGGGTMILNGHLGKYQAKAHTPDQPVFSIASGLHKHLLSKAK